MSDYNLGPYRIKPRGEFDPEANYIFLDLVTYDGGSYVCINYDTIDGVACIGVLPEGEVRSASYWQCIAHKGDKGDTGDMYLPFKTVSNGNWNYNETDKIIVPANATTNIEIENVYDGCCGLILSKQELSFPPNSIYAADFSYVNTSGIADWYLYTFVYANLGSAYNFIWSRSVING